MPMYTIEDAHQAAKTDPKMLADILSIQPELEHSLDKNGNSLLCSAAWKLRLDIFKFLYNRAPGQDPKPVLRHRNNTGYDALTISFIVAAINDLGGELIEYIIKWKGYRHTEAESREYISIFHALINELHHVHPEHVAKLPEIFKLLLLFGFNPNVYSNTLIFTTEGQWEAILTTPLINLVISYTPTLESLIDSLLSYPNTDTSLCAYKYMDLNNPIRMDDTYASNLAQIKQLTNLASKIISKRAQYSAKDSTIRAQRTIQSIAQRKENFSITTPIHELCTLIEECSWYTQAELLQALLTCDEIAFLKFHKMRIDFNIRTNPPYSPAINLFFSTVNNPKVNTRFNQILEQYIAWCSEFPDVVEDFCTRYQVDECGITYVMPTLPVIMETKIYSWNALQINNQSIRFDPPDCLPRDNWIASVTRPGLFHQRHFITPIIELYTLLKLTARLQAQAVTFTKSFEDYCKTQPTFRSLTDNTRPDPYHPWALALPSQSPR